MDKDTIKGLLILIVVGVVIALLAIAGSDDGWHKAGCAVRAILHGVSPSNIRGVCF